jgi:hypothetical protein
MRGRGKAIRRPAAKRGAAPFGHNFGGGKMMQASMALQDLIDDYATVDTTAIRSFSWTQKVEAVFKAIDHNRPDLLRSYFVDDPSLKTPREGSFHLTCIIKACSLSSSSCLKVLLESDVSMTSELQQHAACTAASADDYLDNLEYLASRKLALNIPDRVGMTPLEHYLTKTSQQHVLRLVELGLDPLATASTGQPLSELIRDPEVRRAALIGGYWRRKRGLLWVYRKLSLPTPKLNLVIEIARYL